MKTLSRLVLCLGCCLVAATAVAQNPKGPANKNPQPSPTPNNPGQVVPPGQFGQPFNPNAAAGNAASAAAMREAIMKKFDRDGDGKLNAQEQIAATRAMQERGIRVPGAPNLAGPGNNAGPQSGPGVGQAPAPPPGPKLNKREELLLKRFDKDGDGKLSNDEKAAARAELGQKNKAEKK